MIHQSMSHVTYEIRKCGERKRERIGRREWEKSCTSHEDIMKIYWPIWMVSQQRNINLFAVCLTHVCFSSHNAFLIEHFVYAKHIIPSPLPLPHTQTKGAQRKNGNFCKTNRIILCEKRIKFSLNPLRWIWHLVASFSRCVWRTGKTMTCKGTSSITPHATFISDDDSIRFIGFFGCAKWNDARAQIFFLFFIHLSWSCICWIVISAHFVFIKFFN